MIIHNISNFEHFFKTLDLCNDELTLITPDGSVYDWRKQRPFVQSLLGALDVSKCNKMELRFRDAQDMSHILCYLMECEIKS